MDSRALIVLVLAACMGPKPQARVVSVEASPQPGHERVTIDLANPTHGHGEVELQIELHAPARRIQQTKTVELGSHDHLQVVVDIAAPSDVYTASVEANYPD
jgi:hypothetical protein